MYYQLEIPVADLDITDTSEKLTSDHHFGDVHLILIYSNIALYRPILLLIHRITSTHFSHEQACWLYTKKLRKCPDGPFLLNKKCK